MWRHLVAKFCTNARISNKFMWRHLSKYFTNASGQFASYKVPPVMVSTHMAMDNGHGPWVRCASGNVTFLNTEVFQIWHWLSSGLDDDNDKDTDKDIYKLFQISHKKLSSQSFPKQRSKPTLFGETLKIHPFWLLWASYYDIKWVSLKSNRFSCGWGGLRFIFQWDPW